MDFLELTLSSVEANLALDEALFRAAEAGELGEVLRIWEVPQFAVVVGRASRIDEEVHRQACMEMKVPIVRRCSGGCAVVIGPGCLLYSMVFNLKDRPYWRKVDRLHNDVRTQLVEGLRQSGLNVTGAGTSDLALVFDSSEGVLPRKISGNSVRFGQDNVLYHGTLLYAFELWRLPRFLKAPPREPGYRMGRSHELFVSNVPLARGDLVTILRRIWGAERVLLDWPQERTRILLEQRYGQSSWHEER